MKVTVHLFARARELAGAERIVVDVAESCRVCDLREQLVLQYPALAALAPHLIFAVGTDYVGDDAAIPPDQDVAAIPPVSGG